MRLQHLASVAALVVLGVVSAGSAPATGNGAASKPKPVRVFVHDASVLEGASGTASLSFRVTLSRTPTKRLSVRYATADGTATAPEDYAAAKGTLTLGPSRRTARIVVAVKGDTVVEEDETFVVKLARAVGAKLGRATATGTIRNDDELPKLVAGAPVAVGNGAGLPAPFASGTWVPVTADGTLARVSGGAVVSRTTVGVPTTDLGMLDTAVTDDQSVVTRLIWAASDAGARITAVNPRDGSVVKQFDVTARPGGLDATERAVWAFHFLQGTITRIDIPTMTARTFEVPGAKATGIAWNEGFLWLLTTQPSRALQLDPDTGAVKRTIDLNPPFPRRRSLIDTWWLSAGAGVWATLPNNGAVARIDPVSGAVQYFPTTPYGDPFSVAVGSSGVWVATDRAVLELDGTTGAPKAAASMPTADRTGFVSIAYQYGAAWLGNYDRGTLTALTEPGTPLPPPA